MYDDWKELIATEMQRDLDEIMAEIESDPAMKDIEAPEELYDGLMAMIDEHERQKIYEQLSDEDKELIRLGKVYKKQRKFDKFVVALAAVIVGLGIGSVCIGKDDNIFKMISSMFAGQERTVVNSDDTELVTYVAEEEVYEELEATYGFKPVKLEYLPDNTIFCEAVFSSDMQGVNMIYEMENGTCITYIIRPNYRDSSYGMIVEDEKIQEYTRVVNEIEIRVIEYHVVETGKNRWSVRFEWQDVQYWLSITDVVQEEIEKIVNSFKF